MIYHTYNEYWQAVQTVKKIFDNENASYHDNMEMYIMKERIAETAAHLEMYGGFTIAENTIQR